MKSVVVIPTYNESGNIERLLGEIVALGIPGLRALVVDDRSPDGTSKIVARLAEKHPEIILAERLDEKGRGTAGIAGFDLALQLGTEAVLEMDADFSHPPQDLPRLIEGLERSDIVIASRLAPGARDTRPGSRRLVTRFANRYARFFLERTAHASRIKDWTTGFRAYRRAVFEKVPPSSLVSRGPSILQELLFRALSQGCTASEIPFVMKDRETGKSSFSRKIALQSLMSIPCYRVLFGNSRSGSGEFQLENFSAKRSGERTYEITRARGNDSPVGRIRIG